MSGFDYEAEAQKLQHGQVFESCPVYGVSRLCHDCESYVAYARSAAAAELEAFGEGIDSVYVRPRGWWYGLRVDEKLQQALRNRAAELREGRND